MITRSEYLATPNQVTHQAYYMDIAEEIGLARFKLPVSEVRIREALDAGDEYLTSIPLNKWDECLLPPGSAKAFWARGDFLTMSGQVSLLKEVARHRAKSGENR